MGQIALKKLIASTTDLATMVGKKGDIAVDITKSTVVVFNGSTSGGIPLAKETHTHADATSLASGFMSAAMFVTLQTLAAITDANATTPGYMSAADYNLLQSLAASSGGSGPPNSVGNVPNTLVLRDASGNFAAGIITATLNGNINGNAATVTNGVVTSGSYSNPAWITSLDGSKITGTIGGGVTFSGSVPWTSVTGKPAVVSYFTNDAGYINGSGNTTGTSGGVQSTGGRETAAPNVNTVILRDSAGRAQVSAPLASADIATKAYVDANAGSFGYKPWFGAGLGSTPLSPGSVAPFSLNLVTDGQAGFVKSILLDTAGLVLSGGIGYLNNVFLGFTVDSSPEFSFSFRELISAFGVNNDVFMAYPNNTNAWSGNTFMYKLFMDLPYKISLIIRVYSNVTFSISNPEFNVIVYRYLRVS